jgi:hypothetical protein
MVYFLNKMWWATIALPETLSDQVHERVEGLVIAVQGKFHEFEGFVTGQPVLGGSQDQP